MKRRGFLQSLGLALASVAVLRTGDLKVVEDEPEDYRLVIISTGTDVEIPALPGGMYLAG